MSRGARGSRNTSTISKLIVPFILLVLAIAFLFVFRMQSIRVEGNEHYSDSEIAQIVTNEKLSFNTVFAYLLNRNKKVPDMQFMDSMEVELESPTSICIHVTEKKFAGYFYNNEKYWYFLESGTIGAVTANPEPAYDGQRRYIPYVEGLPLGSINFGGKPMEGNTFVYDQLACVCSYVSGKAYVPQKVTYNGNMQMILDFGDVKANMGTEPDLNERLAQLYGILPETEGLKGTVHLENYDDTKNQVVFEKE